MSYFRERGMHDELVNKFQLGFIPGKWETFSEHATKYSCKKKYLVKTSLSYEKENRLIVHEMGWIVPR